MLLKYPFLSVLLNKKTNTPIVCLILIVSKSFVSFYDMKKIKEDDINDFLRLSTTWWKLDKSLPISIYYHTFNRYNYAKTCLANTEYSMLGGYEGVRLKSLADKRIKRKIIHLENDRNNGRSLFSQHIK